MLLFESPMKHRPILRSFCIIALFVVLIFSDVPAFGTQEHLDRTLTSVLPIQLKGLRSVEASVFVSGLHISYDSATKIEKPIYEIANKMLRDVGLSPLGGQGALLSIDVNTYLPKDEVFSAYLIIEIRTTLSEEAELKRNRHLRNPHGYNTWETCWVDIVRRDGAEAFVLDEVRDQLDTFCSNWKSVTADVRQNKPHK